MWGFRLKQWIKCILGFHVKTPPFQFTGKNELLKNLGNKCIFCGK
jgi:hypothetical protein